MLFDKDVIILHEYGAPSHYAGLLPLCKNKVEFKEFSISRKFFRSLQKRDFKLFFKTLKNFLWLVVTFLLPILNKNKVIVLGMAPLDVRILFIKRVVKYSDVIYHSSWIDWGKGNYPYKNKFFSEVLEDTWRYFLREQVRSIAAVTSKTKEEIANFIGEDSKIHVVYHSFNNEFLGSEIKTASENINVIYVGRIVPQKGISKIIQLAEYYPDINFNLVGGLNPSYAKIIEEKGIHNVEFSGFISSKSELAKLCSENDIVLLPSLRIDGWEELFGISLIEAMAMGCIPLVTDHMGPQEILNNTELKDNIFTESDFVDKSITAIGRYLKDNILLNNQKNLAKKIALNFSQESIGRRWLIVLNHKKG